MIYFAQAAFGPIKIGYTESDIVSRISGIQGENYQKILLLAVMLGREEVEQHLHRKFERYRIRGEWFMASPELMDFISAEAQDPTRDTILAIYGQEKQNDNFAIKTSIVKGEENGSDNKPIRFVSKGNPEIDGATLFNVAMVVTKIGKFAARPLTGANKPLRKARYPEFYTRAVEWGYLEYRVPGKKYHGFKITDLGWKWFNELISMSDLDLQKECKKFLKPNPEYEPPQTDDDHEPHNLRRLYNYRDPNDLGKTDQYGTE